MQQDATPESYVGSRLDGDTIRVRGRATNGEFAVTDRRLLVAGPAGVGLDIPFGTLRRIQFDLDFGRPATLAFVSNDPGDEAIVLNIPPEEYAAVAEALLAIGTQLASLSRDILPGLTDNAATTR
jgi:hypothetical protein